MILRERVPLSTLTTLRVGGEARYVADVANESEVREALRFAREHALPWYVLGSGSNMLASDAGYSGLIIRMLLPRLAFTEEADHVLVVAEAGVPWDALVTEACVRGLWGLENLAGIPGTCGAAPVQNIGAYGSELADTLVYVEVLDPETEEVSRLSKEECMLGYRDSRFKREQSLIIVRVALSLRQEGGARLGYKDLAKAESEGVALSTPLEVATAVRAIRAQKFPDLTKEGTAGSFFKNPTLSKEAFETLQARYPELPGYEGPGGVKISLAWILDRVLSLKGMAVRGARLFEAQPLVIAMTAGARAEDVEELANTVAARVQVETKIVIEREVRSLT